MNADNWRVILEALKESKSYLDPEWDDDDKDKKARIDAAIAAAEAMRDAPAAQPAAIPDDPDEPLGVHSQRWVRVDWNTVVALEQILKGNQTPVFGTLVEMLVRQATDALNSPAPAATAEWEAIPESLKHDIITHAVRYGELLPGYDIVRRRA